MAELASQYWQNLPWTAFSALPPDTVAVLPVAAVEQHGPHLPLCVDRTINEGILRRALGLLAPGFPVLVLPTQAVGLSVEHVRFPGTLTASAETLLALWTEIGHSVARAGVGKLVVLNSHGGQPQLVDIVCRRLRAEAGLFAVGCLWSRLGLPAGLVDGAEAKHGIHGGLIETSLMLHLAPEQVDMRQAQDFRSRWLEQQPPSALLEPEGAVGFGWETQDLNVAGALGNAGRATAETGAAILDHAAARLAELLREVHRLDLAAWFPAGPG